MSHFSREWAEIEKFYRLLSESTCPIWFVDETQKLDAAKWLAARGVIIPNAKEGTPIESERLSATTSEAGQAD